MKQAPGKIPIQTTRGNSVKVGQFRGTTVYLATLFSVTAPIARFPDEGAIA